MANDPILHLLGLARKAGRLEIGEEPVGAACRARQAKLVLLACDAAPNTRRRCAHFGQAGNVLWLELPFTKEELGFQLGPRLLRHAGPDRRGLCRLGGGEAGRPGPGALRPRRPAAAGEGRPGPSAPAGEAAAREEPAGGQTKALGRPSPSCTRRARPPGGAARPPPGRGAPPRPESARPKRGGAGPPNPPRQGGPGTRRLSGKFRHNP